MWVKANFLNIKGGGLKHSPPLVRLSSAAFLVWALSSASQLLSESGDRRACAAPVSHGTAHATRSQSFPAVAQRFALTRLASPRLSAQPQRVRTRPVPPTDSSSNCSDGTKKARRSEKGRRPCASRLRWADGTTNWWRTCASAARLVVWRPCGAFEVERIAHMRRDKQIERNKHMRYDKHTAVYNSSMPNALLTGIFLVHWRTRVRPTELRQLRNSRRSVLQCSSERCGTCA